MFCQPSGHIVRDSVSVLDDTFGGNTATAWKTSDPRDTLSTLDTVYSHPFLPTVMAILLDSSLRSFGGSDQGVVLSKQAGGTVFEQWTDIPGP
jgi:hypothetical protein